MEPTLYRAALRSGFVLLPAFAEWYAEKRATLPSSTDLRGLRSVTPPCSRAGQASDSPTTDCWLSFTLSPSCKLYITWKTEQSLKKVHLGWAMIAWFYKTQKTRRIRAEEKSAGGRKRVKSGCAQTELEKCGRSITKVADSLLWQL